MKIFYSYNSIPSSFRTYDLQGNLIRNAEAGERVKQILNVISERNGGEFNLIEVPKVDSNIQDFIQAIYICHSHDYVEFLKECSIFLGIGEEILEHDFVSPLADPDTFVSKYSYDASVFSAYTAFVAARSMLIDNGFIAALCRPPGHHASKKYLGGFCYLNNSMICASYILHESKYNIGILDLDYHFGDGSADISLSNKNFYYCSLHCDREKTYPFKKIASHDSSNRLKLFDFISEPTIGQYLNCITDGSQFFKNNECKYLIVSMGFDTAMGDPFGGWSFSEDDFFSIGKHLSSLFSHGLIILEGGYHETNLGSFAYSFFEGVNDG